jgi:hypothetical protein
MAAGSGTATLQYDATTGRWRLIAHEQGAWITSAYAAGDFGTNGSGMTWTVDAGDRTGMKYKLSGRSLSVYAEIVTSSIGGVVSSLLSIAPAQYGGFTWGATNISGYAIINDNGVSFVGRWVTFGATGILGQKSDASNWTLSANNTAIFGLLTGEVT